MTNNSQAAAPKNSQDAATTTATTNSSHNSSNQLLKDPCPPLLLRSWAPITTRLLQGQTADASSWYVLDNVVANPPSFVTSLQKELETNGILKSLKAARTNGEVILPTNTGDNSNDEMMKLLRLVQQSQQEKDRNTSIISSVRGDKSAFVGRTARQRDDFPMTFPHLHSLIQSIQTTAHHYLGNTNNNDDRYAFEFDFDLTSVQIASFPGDATSHYPRHCDRKGNQCREEASSINYANTSNGSTEKERLLTFVYYLTPDDWDLKQDGGCLRLFNDDRDGGRGHYVDVAPYQNRMIVFRSDGVEHEVRPSLRRPRVALTVWLYGTIKQGVCNIDGIVKQKEPKGVSTAPAVQQSIPDPPPLPISCLPTTSIGKQRPTIFVSIAAYRDSEIGPTLRHLQAMATDPERVFVGLVLQLDATLDDAIFKGLPTESPWYRSNVRCLNLEARHALGPCYARALCQSLLRGEDFVLQIDSHMRFRKHWDTYLIEQLQGLVTATNNTKVMMTAYPVGYHLPNRIPNETRGTLLVPWKFDKQQGLLRQRGRLMKPQSNPVPCLLYAAGFNFSRSNVVKDCPYDSNLHHLFFGEELTMAVRLYTKGYELYAPAESVCYHLWSRAHRPTHNSTPQPRDTMCGNGNTKWNEERKQKSLQTIRQQLNGSVAYIGHPFGLGNTRSAQEFATALGVDFEKAGMLPLAVGASYGDGLFVDNASHYTAESLGEKIQTLENDAKELIAAFLQ